MANDLQNVADILIDEAAIALRNNSVLPLLVSRDMNSQAAQKNEVINVPVWKAFTPQDVTPGPGNEATDEDLEPMLVPVRLGQWKEVPFSLSDKEMAEVSDGRVLPPNTLRAVAAIADVVNTFIAQRMYWAAWNTEVKESSAAVSDIVKLRTLLNKQNVPKGRERSLVIDDDTGGELLILSAFHEVDKAGETEAIREGSLGRKFGFNIVEMGDMPSHTMGDGVFTVNGAHTAEPGFSGGFTDVAVARTSGTIYAGDMLTFAGHTQQYSVLGSVVSGVVAASSLAANGTIRVMPTLQENVADTAAISYVDSDDHNVNGLAFHRLAAVFATRPLQTQTTPGAIVSMTTDPVSGLSIRVTVTYANHQLRWAFDILYGGEVIYSEMIARLRSA